MATPSRAPFICSACSRTLRSQRQQQQIHTIRTFSHRRPPIDESLPRWKQTPPQMRQPFRIRPLPKQRPWKVNESDEKLDIMYDSFLSHITPGSVRGSQLLPPEIKWLAVTHKSFDHGRQGFNDKLAFLGKRIVDLQTSLALLHAPPSPLSLPDADVYWHPALAGVENITTWSKNQTLERTRLANIANLYGIEKVVRWKPKKHDNLVGSGIQTVLAHTMYSIVGALALHAGGDVAVRTVKQKMLQPLGL